MNSTATVTSSITSYAVELDTLICSLGFQDMAAEVE